MRLAVCAYSGPRAARGVVAQLAKNARHVRAAINRVGIPVFSSFMSVADVGRDDRWYPKNICVHYFGCKTLVQYGHIQKFASRRRESLDFAAE